MSATESVGDRGEVVGTPRGLAAALAAFQGETPTFPKTKTAKVKSQRTGAEYIYKYADLGDILPVVGPLLAKHGLAWTSKPALADGQMVLRYRLLHESGEVDEGEMPLGVASDCKPQELGSAITYMRRYALSAQLNLATQEDDDAQAAQHADRAVANGHQQRPQPVSQNGGQEQPATERPATAKQRGLLNAKAAEAKLPAAEFANCLLRAAGVKEAREFESDEHAQSFVNRQLDRLPARLVDGVLAEIHDASVPF